MFPESPRVKTLVPKVLLGGAMELEDRSLVEGLKPLEGMALLTIASSTWIPKH